MVQIVAQGMRRSGTTILFDLFWGDPRFRCWYEPLNRAREARGGGSKERRGVDYMADVVAARAAFLARRGDGLGQDDLNWGAPRAPELEFGRAWPEHVRDFVAQMGASAEHVFLKFTRASHKVEEIARLLPDAWFLHLVRDPRAVATSHLFRRAPEIRERILADGTFFTLRDGYDQWRAQTMARHLVASRKEYARFAEEPGYVLVMLLWKELYLATRDAARECFGDRHVLVTHDALCAAPVDTLTALHARWGMKTPGKVRRWARKHVRAARPWHAPDAPEWDRAIALLGLQPLLEELAAS